MALFDSRPAAWTAQGSDHNSLTKQEKLLNKFASIQKKILFFARTVPKSDHYSLTWNPMTVVPLLDQTPKANTHESPQRITVVAVRWSALFERGCWSASWSRLACSAFAIYLRGVFMREKWTSVNLLTFSVFIRQAISYYSTSNLDVVSTQRSSYQFISSSINCLPVTYLPRCLTLLRSRLIKGSNLYHFYRSILCQSKSTLFPNFMTDFLCYRTISSQAILFRRLFCLPQKHVHA